MKAVFLDDKQCTSINVKLYDITKNTANDF